MLIILSERAGGSLLMLLLRAAHRGLERLVPGKQTRLKINRATVDGLYEAWATSKRPGSHRPVGPPPAGAAKEPHVRYS